MADDVRARALNVDPAVPHHLVGEKSVFRQAKRVNLARAAIIFRAAMMRI